MISRGIAPLPLFLCCRCFFPTLVFKPPFSSCFYLILFWFFLIVSLLCSHSALLSGHPFHRLSGDVVVCYKTKGRGEPGSGGSIGGGQKNHPFLSVLLWRLLIAFWRSLSGGGGAGGVLPSCLLDFLPQASMSEQIQS